MLVPPDHSAYLATCRLQRGCQILLWMPIPAFTWPEKGERERKTSYTSANHARAIDVSIVLLLTKLQHNYLMSSILN